MRMSAQGWQRIMTAIAADPESRARTVFDILNEPDSLGLRWEAHTNASGVALLSVADAYHEIMAAGYATNPGAAVYGVPWCFLPKSCAQCCSNTLVGSD